jgi:hypothetical protein
VAPRFIRERVLIRERRHRQEGIASRGRKVGDDADERRADVFELIRNLILHPLNERDDGDNRGHADHHAEDGEDRPHLVGADGAESDLDVFENIRAPA